MTHTFFGRGLDAGAIVVEVVEVEPVDDFIDFEFARLGFAHREEVVLAQVAAVDWVACVARNLKLVG